MRTIKFLTLIKSNVSVQGLCGLLYHSIAARVGQDLMTVSKIWNRWFQDGITEHSAGSQPPSITSHQEDRYVTCMALMGRAAMSRALSQELGSFARQQVSARTVRRHLQQHGHSARKPWLRLPLTLHPRQERLQWCDQQRNWAYEW
ncbi:HTH_Tnp_Tc3_2 domain-containing protein [Trichonephila clavipes]|nr:HTH_Tnp_Tc3_2 domain-containing protein [Trichonephila clavipes]